MIVFMGVAGAGKSLQGKLLADALGYRWLSTGEFLRMHISGQRRQEMLEGKLLDDQEIITILDNFFASSDDHQDACVLDGFPRTMTQAKWLVSEHDSGKIHVSAIIHLKASQKAVKARLLARGRPDDTEQAIENRFREYEQETLPIVDWFKQDEIPVYEIDGEQSVDEIHRQIRKALEG